MQHGVPLWCSAVDPAAKVPLQLHTTWRCGTAALRSTTGFRQEVLVNATALLRGRVDRLAWQPCNGVSTPGVVVKYSTAAYKGALKLQLSLFCKAPSTDGNSVTAWTRDRRV